MGATQHVHMTKTMALTCAHCGHRNWSPEATFRWIIIALTIFSKGLGEANVNRKHKTGTSADSIKNISLFKNLFIYYHCVEH